MITAGTHIATASLAFSFETPLTHATATCSTVRHLGFGCCTLLPVVSRLVCSKFDSYVLAGVRAASTLLGLYSEVITNTRVAAQQNSGLVDVHMEGRQRRCNRCYDEFHEMSKQVVRVDTDTHEVELVTQAKQLSTALFDFLKAS